MSDGDLLPGLDTVRPLSQREFEQISKLAHERFGLELKNGKQSLVSARLGKKVIEAGFDSFRQYYDYLVSNSSGEAVAGMIDALTTNYTSFLREPAHFEFLRKALAPELKAGRRDAVRIWSAACSTGEEPYSILFTVLDHLPALFDVRLQILATDISRRALGAAEQAVYTADRLEGLPRHWLPKYFLRGQQNWAGSCRVKPQYRRLVQFGRLNLAQPFPIPGQHTVIFCRNVMIYFDKPTQERVVNRLAAALEPGGYLFIGHSESLTGTDHPLEYVRPAIYRKPQTAVPGADRCLK